MTPHEKYILAYRTNKRAWAKQILDFIETNKSVTVTDVEVLIRKGHSYASQRIKHLRLLGYVETKGQREGHYCDYSLTGRTYEDNMREFRCFLTETYGHK